MKGYLANGLFGLGDRLVNEHVAKTLREAFPELQLYVPQENGEINDKSAYANSIMIAEGDDSYLLGADILVAVLDGVEIDSGVACEIGKFSMLGKPIFGLFTDVRQGGRDNQKKIDALIEDALENQFIYRNLYVIGQIKRSKGAVVSSVEELVEKIKEKRSL